MKSVQGGNMGKFCDYIFVHLHRNFQTKLEQLKEYYNMYHFTDYIKLKQGKFCDYIYILFIQEFLDKKEQNFQEYVIPRAMRYFDDLCLISSIFKMDRAESNLPIYLVLSFGQAKIIE